MLSYIWLIFLKVTARSRSNIQVWFQDLAGSKPLTALAKKVIAYNINYFVSLYHSFIDNVDLL